MIAAIQVGITACRELKTQYMQPVFQMTKHKKLILKTCDPFLTVLLLITLSTASSRGTKAMKSKGDANAKGGQASHSKQALTSARR